MPLLVLQGIVPTYRSKMFCDLGLPTFNTVIHNAQVRLGSSVDIHNNELVKHVFHIW